MNNPIYQELISEDDYFDVLSDERIYISTLEVAPDMSKKLKNLNETIQKLLST